MKLEQAIEKDWVKPIQVGIAQDWQLYQLVSAEALYFFDNELEHYKGLDEGRQENAEASYAQHVFILRDAPKNKTIYMDFSSEIHDGDKKINLKNLLSQYESLGNILKPLLKESLQKFINSFDTSAMIGMMDTLSQIPELNKIFDGPDLEKITSCVIARHLPEHIILFLNQLQKTDWGIQSLKEAIPQILPYAVTANVQGVATALRIFASVDQLREALTPHLAKVFEEFIKDQHQSYHSPLISTYVGNSERAHLLLSECKVVKEWKDEIVKSDILFFLIKAGKGLKEIIDICAVVPEWQNDLKDDEAWQFIINSFDLNAVQRLIKDVGHANVDEWNDVLKTAIREDFYFRAYAKDSTGKPQALAFLKMIAGENNIDGCLDNGTIGDVFEIIMAQRDYSSILFLTECKKHPSWSAQISSNQIYSLFEESNDHIRSCLLELCVDMPEWKKCLSKTSISKAFSEIIRNGNKDFETGMTVEIFLKACATDAEWQKSIKPDSLKKAFSLHGLIGFPELLSACSDVSEWKEHIPSETVISMLIEAMEYNSPERVKAILQTCENIPALIEEIVFPDEYFDCLFCDDGRPLDEKLTNVYGTRPPVFAAIKPIQDFYQRHISSRGSLETRKYILG